VCIDATAPLHEVAHAVMSAVADDRAWVRLPPVAKGADSAALDAARARTAASWLHQADLELRACVAQLVRTGTAAPAWAPGNAAAGGRAADVAVTGNGAAAAGDGGTPAAYSGLPAAAASGQPTRVAGSVEAVGGAGTEPRATTSSPADTPPILATTGAAPEVGVFSRRIDAASGFPADDGTERHWDDGGVAAGAAQKHDCKLSAPTAAAAGVQSNPTARQSAAGVCVATHRAPGGSHDSSSTVRPVESPARGTEASSGSLAPGSVDERLAAATSMLTVPPAWSRQRAAEAANTARKAALIALRPLLLSAASVDAVAGAGGDESRGRAECSSAGAGKAPEPGGLGQDIGGWLKLRVRAEFGAQLRLLLPPS
jgi:hypothetical protein